MLLLLGARSSDYVSRAACIGRYHRFRSVIMIDHTSLQDMLGQGGCVSESVYTVPYSSRSLQITFPNDCSRLNYSNPQKMYAKLTESLRPIPFERLGV